MSLSAHIARFTASLLLIAAAGSVMAASNTNALLGASDLAVLELNEQGITRSALASVNPGVGPLVSIPTSGIRSAKAAPQRLPSHENRGFDWSTLISLGFGIVGLLWVRRRTADL